MKFDHGKKFGLFWRFLGLMFVAAVPIKADTTYTYTGNQFNMLSGSLTCPPVCSISGFFTLASPITFTDFELVTPLAYSFTDGSTTRTSADPVGINVFAVSGDGSGNIFRWSIDVGEESEVQLESLFFPDNSSTDSSGSAAGLAFVAGNPGTWSTSTVPTPETSSFGLILAGVSVVLVMKLREGCVRSSRKPPKLSAP